MNMFRELVWLTGLLVGASGIVQAQSRASELPPGEGREMAHNMCATACHDAVPLLIKRDGEVGWRKNVERMVVQKGVQIAPEDLDPLVRYLATRLGPGSGRMETPGLLPPGALGGGGATSRDVRLPDGPGQEIVRTRCTPCHDLGRVVSLRRTAREWDQMTRDMMGRTPRADPAQIDRTIAYLTTHFGKQARQQEMGPPR